MVPSGIMPSQLYFWITFLTPAVVVITIPKINYSWQESCDPNLRGRCPTYITLTTIGTIERGDELFNFRWCASWIWLWWWKWQCFSALKTFHTTGSLPAEDTTPAAAQAKVDFIRSWPQFFQPLLCLECNFFFVSVPIIVSFLILGPRTLVTWPQQAVRVASTMPSRITCLQVMVHAAIAIKLSSC